MKRRGLAVILALTLLPACPAIASDLNTGDAAGTVSFECLAAHICDSSPMLRAYDEMIAAADAVDRAAAYEDLMRAHNGLSDVIWVYLQAGDTGSAMVLQKQQEQLKEQLDAYKPEHYAKAYADLVLPVRALSNQLIRGAERLYLAIAVLEQDIARSNIRLAALDRAVQEARLLHSLGRVPLLTCTEAEAARDAERHQLDTLVGQNEVRKAQLQVLLGQPPTGELNLAPVPGVLQSQLSGLQYDADLTAGMEHNLDLYRKERAMADAQEKWEDAQAGYQKKTAEHSYNAAVYAYEAEKLNFQQSFGAVSRSLADAQRAVAAAQEALSYRQAVCNAAQLRYALGSTSKSALLTAHADLALAELDVQTASIGLTSAYGSYCWARRGLLAGQT